MKFFKLCTLLLVIGVISGCQTTQEIGSGDVNLSDEMKSEYIEYLAVTSTRINRTMYTAYALNPITGRSNYSGNSRSLSKAQNKALEYCGEGCKLFALNRKVVWFNYSDKAELDGISKKLISKSNANIEHYSSDMFDVNYRQKAELNNVYLPNVAARGSRDGAFAISRDGQTSSILFMNGRLLERHDVEKATMLACNAKSGNDDCVVYAYNEHVYGQ